MSSKNALDKIGNIPLFDPEDRHYIGDVYDVYKEELKEIYDSLCLLSLLRNIVPINDIYTFTNDNEKRIEFDSCSVDVSRDEGDMIDKWLEDR